MSFTPCPLCWSPLVGREGSACTNPQCLNSAEVRSRPIRDVKLAPLTGQVTSRQGDELERARRKKARKAQRVARRANRRAA